MLSSARIGYLLHGMAWQGILLSWASSSPAINAGDVTQCRTGAALDWGGAARPHTDRHAYTPGTGGGRPPLLTDIAVEYSS